MIVMVGLGNLGLALGGRLVECGHDVCGVDLAEARRSAWAELTGRTAAPSLDEVDWAQAERVFVVVRLTEQAAAVLDRLAAEPGERTCFVVTTLDPSFAGALGDRARPGLRVVELPVSGGAAGASGGTLTAMAAGPLSDADARLLTTTLAAHLVTFDAYGEPTLAKLFNNVTGAYNALVLAEMLLLAERAGVDPRRLHQVLLTSSGGSWMAAGFADLLDDLLDKDVRLLRAHLGGLPDLSLGTGLPERLAAARRLLA
ncbi:NAD(P)-binding domain-containing protein [Actinomadura sp. NBRC 104412]|uniref:NAD(P)-binding domain-containing protein n=1 Tax=Actinomadura sp. NBRC 104412 TaxID=3032203 RepID=UPI0025578619|nr:NAD(P)-binding domain-containing protein [Actinomadura sp. NBRC 104412]